MSSRHRGRGGFRLNPCVPYAWQNVGQAVALASTPSPRQNILDFFNRHQEFHAVAVQGSINTQTVIHGFNRFRPQLHRPAVIVVDNAPSHTSEDFSEQLQLWQAQDLAVKVLSSYSPERNLIEILWRKIKSEGLPLDV
jgi:DDE superfamily endonuclease